LIVSFNLSIVTTLVNLTLLLEQFVSLGDSSVIEHVKLADSHLLVEISMLHFLYITVFGFDEALE
jgi:hypothetical protein